MYEKKKKVEDLESDKSIVQDLVPEQPKKEATVSKSNIPNTQNYILRLEGLVSQIQKELEKVPVGDIPVKAVYEAADVRTFGKQSYLFFMEKSKNPNEKIFLIDAVGLEDLSRKVSDIYGKYRLIDVISQRINKRLQSKKIYLAIFVGE